MKIILPLCHDIPFMTRDFSFLINQYMQKGFDLVDAYLLSNILHKVDETIDLNDERYLISKDYIYKTIDLLDKKEEIPILFFKEFYTTFKDKDDFKNCSQFYLDIMIQMLSDALENKNIDDGEYNDKIAKLQKHQPMKLLEIFTETNDKLLYNAERKLSFDSIAHKIILYI